MSHFLFYMRHLRVLAPLYWDQLAIRVGSTLRSSPIYDVPLRITTLQTYRPTVLSTSENFQLKKILRTLKRKFTADGNQVFRAVNENTSEMPFLFFSFLCRFNFSLFVLHTALYGQWCWSVHRTICFQTWIKKFVNKNK